MNNKHLQKYFSLVIPIMLALCISNLIAVQAAPALPIIPGAVGFGITTPAGSGRHLSTPQTTVYKVTNLNSSGSGSLAACTGASGPRVCVFEVAGTINLTSELKVKNPYITIAGQTAPSPGITLRGAGLRITTHDVLVQHIRIRVGDNPNGPNPENRDGLGINGQSGVYNIVVYARDSEGLFSEPMETYVVKGVVKGDINGDGFADQVDADIALQVLAGKSPSGIRAGYTTSGADVNGDNRIGMEELIYILERIDGIR